jgi:hypothetical protein
MRRRATSTPRRTGQRSSCDRDSDRPAGASTEVDTLSTRARTPATARGTCTGTALRSTAQGSHNDACNSSDVSRRRSTERTVITVMTGSERTSPRWAAQRQGRRRNGSRSRLERRTHAYTDSAAATMARGPWRAQHQRSACGEVTSAGARTGPTAAVANGSPAHRHFMSAGEPCPTPQTTSRSAMHREHTTNATRAARRAWRTGRASASDGAWTHPRHCTAASDTGSHKTNQSAVSHQPQRRRRAHIAEASPVTVDQKRRRGVAGQQHRRHHRGSRAV